MSDEPLILNTPEREPLIFDIEAPKPFAVTDYAFIKGDKGLSAYEVAVNNGFVGTEAEWLASLKGNKGDIGLTGISAYQSYLNTTSDNPKLTEIEWANLNGAIYTLLSSI